MTATAQKVEERHAEIPWWVFDAIEDRTKDRRFYVTKGLGSGGTYGGCIWHVHKCLETPGVKFSWAVAPTYLQVVDTLIPTFCEVMQHIFGWAEGDDYAVVRSGRPVIYLLRTGQEIQFRSAQHADRLVGPTISHLLGTEPGLWPEIAFEKSAARVRHRDAACQVFLEGTPEGLGDRWEQLANFSPGIDEERNAWRIVLHSADNPFVSASYNRNLGITYAHDPAKLEAYTKGTFTSFTKGTAYWNYVDRHPLVTLGIRPDKALPLIWCWDFNRSPLAWIVMQRGFQTRAGMRMPCFRVLFESSGNSKGLLEAVGEFMARLPAAEWGQHRIEIYGDASGFFGSHKSPLCDYSQIESYMRQKSRYTNVSVLAQRANPEVRPRLERVNALFAYEMVQIEASCSRLRSGLCRTALKEGTWDIEKPTRDMWTHYPDAFGYGVYALTQDLDFEIPAELKVYGLSTR